jgi:tripartite ATP-independent transporter DctP family solute receptor
MSFDRRRFLVAAAGAGLSLAGLRTRAQAATVLTATDVHVPGYPTVEALRWIGSTLAQETGGRLGVHLYHSGQLGRESDAIDMARFGALDIARVHMSALNNPFPATQILCLPYVFDDVAHMRRAIDGAPGRRILDAFSKRGLVGLAIYDSGARCVYNTRRPVHVPADLHGLKLRVPPSDIFMDLLRTLGANPTPLPYGETYSALQTHLIDGAENNWQSFHTTRQFEVAHYWSQTEHSLAPEALLMSQRRYDALSPADRDLVRDVAARSVPMMRERWDQSENAARDHVLGHGVAFNTVDRAAFRALAAPVLERRLGDPLLQQLYKDIRGLA